jgi:hypothetical protein
MRGRLSRLGFILACAVLLFAGNLSAQTISGIIAGQVTDPQQKALPSVSIIAHNAETGRDFPASTDGQGHYSILEVPPGLYEVTALLGGFETQHHVHVRVDVNRTTREDFPLKIQTKEEAITVESTSPMAVLDSPTLSSAFTEKHIVELPIITRDVNNLALLAPGVESVRTFSFASTLVPFSVNGSRGRDNNFTIDSVDNNEPLLGGAASQFTNSDIFSEYEIATDQLKAEFGRNSGGTINAITRSGSNNWHGTMFAFGQDDLFNAMNQVEKLALQTSPEASYDTTLGLTLGGPIKKEKAFFFLSYQWDRLTDNLSDVFPVLSNYPLAGATGLSVLQGLPTDPALQAFLATPSVTRIPALTGTPCFAGKPTSNSSGLYSPTNPCLVSNTMVPVTAQAGVVTCPQDCVNFNVWNAPNVNSFSLRDHQVSGRFDQRINNSNDFFTRYLFDDLASPLYPLNSAAVGAFSDIGLLSDWKTFNRARTQSFLIDHRYSRVNSLNEFRMSFSRVSQGQGAFGEPASVRNGQAGAIIADQFASPGAIGGLGGTTGLFQSAGDLLTLGTDSSPSQISSNTYQIQDNYSYTYKKHSFKFGANFARIDSNNLAAPGDLGFYLYPSSAFFYTATATPINGFQDFLNNPDLYSNPVAATYVNPTTGQPLVGPAGTSTSAAVSQRLINVQTNAAGMITGLGPNEIKIKQFDQFYFAQDDWRVKSNLTVSFGLRYENFGQPINSVHDLNKSAPFVSTDNKDFAPRLGFAWSPENHWVVRGGYTIGYNPPILDIPLLMWQSGPVSPLVVTDNVGIAQLQPTGAYPGQPFSLADFQQTLPAGSTLDGFTLPSPVSTGMVQGCSSYFDLYDFLAPSEGFPALPVAGSRAYNGNAVNPATGTTLPVNIPIVNCSDQNTVAKNLKNPYYQSWSLGVQHELGANYLLELSYVGGKGSRLFQRIDENPYMGWNTDCLANIGAAFAAAGFGGAALPAQCRLPRLDNSHGDILEVTNGGSSSYNALQASLTKRYSRTKYLGDLTFSATYTWSHLIDNTSEIFGPEFRTIQHADFNAANSAGVPTLLLDPNANEPVESITAPAEITNQTTSNERGNSSFDRRHRLANSLLWEPFPTKNVFLRGWQLNGIFTFQSGQPFSPLNASLQSACADATGAGFLSNTRPLIGNPHAPRNSVALVDLTTDPTCLAPGVASGPASISYVDLNGNPIDPKTAHFVQVPLGLFAPIQPNAGGRLGNQTIATTSGPETFTPAGRNTLVGPKLTNLDLALLRNMRINERFHLQFRWEVYDVLNHPNLAYFNGSPYIASAVSASPFAFSNQRTAASITGGIPENAIDAIDSNCTAGTICAPTGRKNPFTFLSTSTMNTGNRRMQFGLRLIF